MPSVSDRKKRIMNVLLMTTYSLKIILFSQEFLEMEIKRSQLSKCRKWSRERLQLPFFLMQISLECKKLWE